MPVCAGGEARSRLLAALERHQLWRTRSTWGDRGDSNPDLQGHNLRWMTVVARASPVYDRGDLRTPWLAPVPEAPVSA